MSATPVPTTLTIFFDGSCDFCTRTVRLLRKLDRRGRITWLPFQNEQARDAAGLTLEACERSVWSVTPDGERGGGAEAMNMIVAVIMRRWLPLRIYRLPGMRQFQDWGYRMIATNRHRLPGDTPYCQQHPEACGAGQQLAAEQRSPG